MYFVKRLKMYYKYPNTNNRKLTSLKNVTTIY